MPGAVPITSTYALTNATLPYVLELAELGLANAVKTDPAVRRGVNIAGGHVTHPAVASSLGLPLVPLDEALGAVPATTRT
jgi:alanine dehydrogenase